MGNHILTSIYSIKSDKCDNTVFAFVSDFHDSEVGPVMDIINENKADAVLIGGDFVHNNAKYKNGIELLKQCSKEYPTFVEIGNHETKSGLDIKKIVNDSGATLLDDSYTSFRDIVIGGLTTGFGFGMKQSPFKKTPKPNLDWISDFTKQKGFKILLNHHPEYYPRYLKDMNIDLILSGHAHGGQWRLGKYGLIAPGQGLFPKYTSGMYDDKLIVSRGANRANLVPRINNKPEVVIIRMEKNNG